MFFFFDDDNTIGESQSLFDSIKHVNEYGQEYWTARELQPVLGYKQWRRFSETIGRAQDACETSGYNVSEHFAKVGKMIKIGQGGEREVDDYNLSRYACYLIAMNGNPKKDWYNVFLSFKERYYKAYKQYFFEDQELDRESNVQKMNIAISDKPVNRKHWEAAQADRDDMAELEKAMPLIKNRKK